MFNTIYTRTITDEARKRGISVEVIDRETPIFVLKHAGRSVRCANVLSDKVGAVSFLLADDKHLANRFLSRYGFPVPKQIKYSGFEKAQEFLQKCKSVVVKPCRQWGGHGVSVAVKTVSELRQAILRARAYGEDLVIEEYVEGEDHRLVFTDGHLVTAIKRIPASVTGDGKATIRRLIQRQNARIRRVDADNLIPLDNETRRTLTAQGLSYNHVPARDKVIRVRRTSNYHTGGTEQDITEKIDADFVREGQKIARLFDLPLLGIDFLVNPQTGRHWIIETSPHPPLFTKTGNRGWERFLDCLFPETRKKRTPPKITRKTEVK
jgi:D-alanine-D-alanine ligase-like ATP-grasp enzyme